MAKRIYRFTYAQPPGSLREPEHVDIAATYSDAAKAAAELMALPGELVTGGFFMGTTDDYEIDMVTGELRKK